MKIKSIGLCWITVSDLTQAKKFFGDILGLSISQDTPENGWVEFKTEQAGTLLGVAQSLEKRQETCSEERPGSNAVITFTVDDIDQGKQYLLEKQVRLLGDIIEIPGHVKMLLFLDPDGNKFQLVQELI